MILYGHWLILKVSFLLLGKNPQNNQKKKKSQKNRIGLHGNVKTGKIQCHSLQPPIMVWCPSSITCPDTYPSCSFFRSILVVKIASRAVSHLPLVSFLLRARGHGERPASHYATSRSSDLQRHIVFTSIKKSSLPSGLVCQLKNNIYSKLVMTSVFLLPRGVNHTQENCDTSGDNYFIFIIPSQFFSDNLIAKFKNTYKVSSQRFLLNKQTNKQNPVFFGK